MQKKMNVYIGSVLQAENRVYMTERFINILYYKRNDWQVQYIHDFD